MCVCVWERERERWEGWLHIPQIFSNTGKASPSDWLVSYTGLWWLAGWGLIHLSREAAVIVYSPRRLGARTCEIERESERERERERDFVLFCFVLWHINHYWLFKVKSSLCIYIYIYIYIYIIRELVVSKSLCGDVWNQVQYNMESAQYLG